MYCSENGLMFDFKEKKYPQITQIHADFPIQENTNIFINLRKSA